MEWFQALPGHRQICYWLWKKGRSWVIVLCDGRSHQSYPFNVQQFHKMHILYIHVSLTQWIEDLGWPSFVASCWDARFTFMFKILNHLVAVSEDLVPIPIHTRTCSESRNSLPPHQVEDRTPQPFLPPKNLTGLKIPPPRCQAGRLTWVI